MMNTFIKQLDNPKTEEYLKLKDIILSSEFTWTYKGSTNPALNVDDEVFTANPIYQHSIVAGVDVNPSFLVPRVESRLSDHVFVVIRQILDFNKIEYNQIHRCVINQIHYWDGKPSPPHKDHYNFYHRNCIIYLNEFDDGQIDVYSDDGQEKQFHKPYEDDIVTFDGLHHSVHQPAPMQRRVVIVFTYS